VRHSGRAPGCTADQEEGVFRGTPPDKKRAVVCVCLVIPGLFSLKGLSVFSHTQKRMLAHTQFSVGHINPHPSKCSKKIDIVIIIINIRSCFVVTFSHTFKDLSCSRERGNKQIVQSIAVIVCHLFISNALVLV